MIRALPLMGALLLACAPHRAAAPRGHQGGGPLEGRPLAMVAHDLRGAEVRLGGTGDVRVVDVFASWCEPCRAQLPALGRLAETHAGRGLAVIAVSMDEDRAALDRFLAEVSVSVPVLWDPGGARSAHALQILRLPTTLVVDRQGVIRHAHVGYDARSDAKLERDVEALLEE